MGMSKEEKEHWAQVKRVAADVIADESEIGRRMTLPTTPEMPDLQAMRRMSAVVVALPQPGDLRAEFYGDTYEQAIRDIARFFPRDDLLWAADRRGITNIHKRATRKDLARALVHLGPAYFDEIERTGGPGEGYEDTHLYDDHLDDYVDRDYADADAAGDTHDPDDVADFIAHDIAVHGAVFGPDVQVFRAR